MGVEKVSVGRGGLAIAEFTSARPWTLGHSKIRSGTDAAVTEAEAAGVSGMITVGCDRETSQAAIAVAAAHSNVWATVGLHPHDAINGVDTIADLLAELPDGDPEATPPPEVLLRTLEYVSQIAPTFSLRGGTREILRGVIARGLALR